MKKIFYLSLILIFALSCSKGAQPAKPLAKGVALAVVNGTAITAEDVKREFAMLPAEIQEHYKSEGNIESLIQELVKKEVLYQIAQGKGYDKQKKFAEEVEEFRKRLMIEHLLRDEIEKKASVSDEDAKAFYEQNKESFVRRLPGENKTETIGFDMVKDLIKERLLMEQQKALFNSFIANVVKGAKADINKEEIKKAFGNGVSP